jgi:hypothetical protein
MNRADRLTNPDFIGSIAYEKIYAAIQPVDGIAHEMENKWGVGRLLKLVSVETAAKFGTAKAKLDQAINEDEHQAVEKKASVMVRAWKALDDEATKLGHKPIEAAAMVATDDQGNSFTVVASLAEATHLAKQGVEGHIYNLPEIARILYKWESKTGLGRAKDLFPGSEIVGIRGGSLPKDDLPF